MIWNPFRQSSIGKEAQNISALLWGSTCFLLGIFVTLGFLIWITSVDDKKEPPKFEGGISLPYLPPSE